MRIVALLAVALTIGACATYREDLDRGQRLYEENEYEHALAIWRELEPDADSLSEKDQARYDYLRGMTDYRLQFRPDARHWLALAKAVDMEHPGGLSPQWSDRLKSALDDLNKDVYGGSGMGASASMATETTKGPSQGSAGAPGNGNSGACHTNSECPPGQSCQANECVPL
jgi:hypothetical protein